MVSWVLTTPLSSLPGLLMVVSLLDKFTIRPVNLKKKLRKMNLRRITSMSFFGETFVIFFVHVTETKSSSLMAYTTKVPLNGRQMKFK